MNGKSVGVFAGLAVVVSAVAGCGPIAEEASVGGGAGGMPIAAPSFVPSPGAGLASSAAAVGAQQGSGSSCVADFSPSDGPGPRDGTARKIGGGVRISCPGVDEIRSFTAFLHVEWHSTGADWEIQDTSEALFGPGHDGIAYGDCRVGTWRFVVELHGTDGQGRDLIITPTASREQTVTTCP